jgi:hypothetical protein
MPEGAESSELPPRKLSTCAANGSGNLLFAKESTISTNPRRTWPQLEQLLHQHPIASGLEPQAAEQLLTHPDPEFELRHEPGIIAEILNLTHRQPYRLVIDWLDTTPTSPDWSHHVKIYIKARQFHPIAIDRFFHRLEDLLCF